jgi:hypothetical protein
MSNAYLCRISSTTDSVCSGFSFEPEEWGRGGQLLAALHEWYKRPVFPVPTTFRADLTKLKQQAAVPLEADAYSIAVLEGSAEQASDVHWQVENAPAQTRTCTAQQRAISPHSGNALCLAFGSASGLPNSFLMANMSECAQETNYWLAAALIRRCVSTTGPLALPCRRYHFQAAS